LCRQDHGDQQLERVREGELRRGVRMLLVELVEDALSLAPGLDRR
jgi:hypothetical protein